MRKVLHMQKCYPVTLQRLNRGAAKRSQDECPERPEGGNQSNLSQQRAASGYAGGNLSGKCRETCRENAFCKGHMEYNRRKAREAQVGAILTGQSPLDNKTPLYPSRATDQELLAMVRHPANADKAAPSVERPRKWLGDNVGWEGDNGVVPLLTTFLEHTCIVHFHRSFCAWRLRVIAR